MLKRLLHNKVIKSAILFVVLYSLSLIIWLIIKNAYGCIMSHLSISILSLISDIEVQKINCLGEKTVSTIATLTYLKGKIAQIELNIPTQVSTYTYNVPITMACVTTFIAIFGFRTRSIFEAFLLLLLTHLLYLISLEKIMIFQMEQKVGIGHHSTTTRIVWEFSLSFLKKLALRFEPFIVVCYLYLKRF